MYIRKSLEEQIQEYFNIRQAEAWVKPKIKPWEDNLYRKEYVKILKLAERINKKNIGVKSGE
jgi:hypothetical protein